MARPSEHLSVSHQEMLDDWPEAESRKKRQRTDDDDDADKEAREERRGHRERAERRRNLLLASQTSRYRERRNDHEETAEEHRQAECRVVPVRVHTDTAECGAVVGGAGGVRVEDFRETVWSPVENARGPDG